MLDFLKDVSYIIVHKTIFRSIAARNVAMAKIDASLDTNEECVKRRIFILVVFQRQYRLIRGP